MTALESEPEQQPLIEGDRTDLRWLVGLALVAFVIRFFSPIFPDFFAHPFSGPPVSNCVHRTPVDPAGHLGTLCGLAYPFQRGYASGGSSYQPPDGQVFDEIYFATFAHDDLKGIQYFDPEPPLSKLIIAGGQVGWGWFRATFQGAQGDFADLGYNTFGWRIMSCLVGVLCVPMIYLLARQLWPQSRLFAIAAGTLVTVDGMFFIQSRIGMIDIFPIFFILLSYWLYLVHVRSRTPTQSLATLLILGAVIGLAVASKWIALAAFLSILILLLFQLVRSRRAPGGPDPTTYALAAVIAFVLLPILIYIVSWTPFFMRGQFTSMAFNPIHMLQELRCPLESHLNGANLWDYQVQAFCYHATLKATHPYGSPWWTWPLLLRPVAYYYQGSGLGIDQWSHRPLVAGMVNLGNPIIWWASLFALLALPWIAWRKRSFAAVLIMLGFVTQYLPWVRITRVVFLYHMFGGLTFMVLALAFVLATLAQEGLPKQAVGAFLGLAVAFFLFFYPVWTATPISDLAYLGGLPRTTEAAGLPPWGGKMWLQANCVQPAHPVANSWIPCWI